MTGNGQSQDQEQSLKARMGGFWCIGPVFVMLFVVAAGLGPFAGVLALWVHATGSPAKLFAESVEAIDPHPVEGVCATGARGPRRSPTA